MEEEWCVTSTLLKSLQHAHFLRREEEKQINDENNTDSARSTRALQDGCVISPCVEVFRESHTQGYMFMSEPVTLASVISILYDSYEQVSENDFRRLMRNVISAVTKSGAEVLVCPYDAIAKLLDDPAAAGSLFGQVLTEPSFVNSIAEVVLLGNRIFAQAVALAIRGEGIPEELKLKASSAPTTPVSLPSRTDSITEQSFSRSCKSLGKTPRHGSSEFVGKHYTEIREIGRGAFGKITLVRENATGDERVCKAVSIAGMREEMVRMLKKEAELLCSLDHPGIVRLYEYAEDPDMQQIILILEYIPGGGCDDLLAQSLGVPLSESLVVKIIHQVLVTLAYCHAKGIVHRDLKPENIMLTCRPLWRTPDVKLIDFGAAAGYEELKNEVIGTIEYMAPEVVKGRDAGAKSEIWSLAATTFELLLGEPPFGSCNEEDGKGEQDEEVQKRILEWTGNLEDLECHASLSIWQKWQCRHDRPWEASSAEAQDFLRWLLNPNPDKRPTAAEALEHPWLEMHRPQPSRITNDMALSLASYVKAPKVVQCCMVIVAASLGAPDLEDVSAAFLTADSDCDGKLSAKELSHALSEIVYSPEESGQSAQTSVKELLLSGDLGRSEGHCKSEHNE
jgi:serine/threonine protein kinase